MSGPYEDDIMLHIREALKPIMSTTDSRFMFSALCAYTNVLGEKLIAAGLVTPENVCEHYLALIDCAQNTKPNTEAAQIKYISNGQLVDKPKLN